MNKFFTVATILLLVIAAGEASAAVTCVMQASGTTETWTNELGSTAKLTVDANGNVTGTYADGSGTGSTGPLIGYCNGYAITFTVAWTGSQSITSWSGTGSKKSITTLWYLVDGSSSKWSNTNAGTDTFTLKK